MSFSQDIRYALPEIDPHILNLKLTDLLKTQLLIYYTVNNSANERNCFTLRPSKITRNAKSNSTILRLTKFTKQLSSSSCRVFNLHFNLFRRVQISICTQINLPLIMAPSKIPISFITIIFLIHSCACTFTIINNCPYTIWPGTLAGSGTPQLATTGFQLDPGLSVTVPSAPGWSGRIWARTGCMFDATGVGSCRTGDCGGRLECDGAGATPPASLFEITLGIGDQKDFYDVSIVDGYNLPLVATPRGVYEGCNSTGCVADINMGCPRELQVMGSDEGQGGGVVACKSACEAFGLDQYCCSGEFANPTTCRPSFYSGIFKRACPRAYSYAFDDGTSTFTCKASEYAIIFCPNNGMRRIDGGLQAPAVAERRNEKISPAVSSSAILKPFPMSIFVLLFILYYRHT